VRIPNKEESDVEANKTHPDWINDYFVVRNRNNIRPYGVLIKQIQWNIFQTLFSVENIFWNL